MGRPGKARAAAPLRGLGLALLGLRLCGRGVPGDARLCLLGATRRVEHRAVARPGPRLGRAPGRHAQTRNIGGPQVSERKAEALKVLGLPPGASYKAARASYRKLARKMHPDVVGASEASEASFRRVIEAWATVVAEGEEDWTVRERILAAWQEMREEKRMLGIKWRAKLRARAKLGQKMMAESMDLKAIVALLGVSYVVNLWLAEV
mmetsp:Transcript_41855/g.110601  ORF Transcript_41855/g.110601 Transcript_41855/m.110601 type:complete len:207 (-) Transcript_41855:109-729(-)